MRLWASRFFALLIWLHVPIVAGIAVSNGMAAWHVALVMAGAATVASLAVWRAPGAALTRMIVAAALTMVPILMVYAGTGPWQVDWHMYFFVVFGMLVAYVDWRPIAVATALTAAHHGILSVLFPSAVFPEADFARVLLHAGIVAVDALVLFFIVRLLANAHQTLKAAHTSEVDALTTSLAGKLHELEGTFVKLEAETAERHEIAERVDHLAHHDLVTGLPNRVLLMDRLAQAMAGARRAGGEIFVMYLDLDHFKEVNDTTGHGAGDEVLTTIAARIAESIRAGDTASRVGGDEFVIVCAAADGVKETPIIVERLLAAVAAPMKVGPGVLRLGASIGVSLFPQDGSSPEELFQKANVAMYRAKKSGGNTFHLYTPEIQAEMLAESQLRQDLEQAIRLNEFVVHYQPIVSLTSRAVIGAEALVRWQHPQRGLLQPGEFIGFAEDHGLIGQIGDAVFSAACAQIGRFAELSGNGEFTMAINVSALQFRHAGFTTKVTDLLAAHRIDRSRLEIEITESVIMDNADSAITTLQELKALGVKLSIDDFGTGYSSLSYIKNFPVHTLKIDRSFIIEIATNTTDQAIAATIIALAHNLGMRVIAEGIETPEQLEWLRLLGADDMQGYLMSRPLPANDFEAFVRAHQPLIYSF